MERTTPFGFGGCAKRSWRDASRRRTPLRRHVELTSTAATERCETSTSAERWRSMAKMLYYLYLSRGFVARGFTILD